MIRRWWWIFLVMAVIGPGLGFVVAAAVTYVMPKKYESVAVVQVRSESRQIATEGDGEPSYLMPSRFIATEFEVIKAKKTLEMAADRLDLTNRWGADRKSVIEMLRKMISVDNLRGTDLIRIAARHTNAEDARDIAMATAQAYRDRKGEHESAQLKLALEVQEKLLREQEDRVEEKRKILEKLLADQEPGSDGTGAGGVYRQEVIDAQDDYVIEKRRAEEVRKETQLKKVELELPRSPIVIHEEPTLARAPVSPNVKLNLLGGLVAGFPLGLLLALPIVAVVDRIARK